MVELALAMIARARAGFGLARPKVVVDIISFHAMCKHVLT